MRTEPVVRILPLIHVTGGHCSRNLRHFPKILVIAVHLVGENRVNGMMEIVVPLRRKPVSAFVCWVHGADIVSITLCNQVNLPAQCRRRRVDHAVKFAYEWPS